MAMAAIAIQPVWEGLAEHRWSDAQLAELDRELGKLDFLTDYEREMRSEMALRVAKVDYLRRHRRALANRTVGDDSSPPLPVRVLCHLIPSGWFYQNQLRFARLIVHHFLPAVDLNRGVMSPVFIKDAYAKIEADAKQLNPYVTAQAYLLRDIGPGARKFARIQGIVDLARAACALERYRLAHGEYPASLDVLAPQFITKLPHDIIGGQPLKYHRTEDGQFVLYSIGWNEKDDGGQIELTERGRVDVDKGDWVWRYPAK
jgi:hypothetical protein